VITSYQYYDLLDTQKQSPNGQKALEAALKEKNDKEKQNNENENDEADFERQEEGASDQEIAKKEAGKEVYLIDHLLLGGSRKVLEYTMTFVNALASECLGRSYLLQKPDLVELLVKVLHEE